MPTVDQGELARSLAECVRSTLSSVVEPQVTAAVKSLTQHSDCQGKMLQQALAKLDRVKCRCTELAEVQREKHVLQEQVISLQGERDQPVMVLGTLRRAE